MTFLLVSLVSTVLLFYGIRSPAAAAFLLFPVRATMWGGLFGLLFRPRKSPFVFTAAIASSAFGAAFSVAAIDGGMDGYGYTFPLLFSASFWAALSAAAKRIMRIHEFAGGPKVFPLSPQPSLLIDTKWARKKMPFIFLATGRYKFTGGELPFTPRQAKIHEITQTIVWGASLFPTDYYRPVDDQKTSLYSDRTGVREIVLLPSSGLFTTIYEKTNRSEVGNCPSAHLLAFCGKDSTLRPSAGIDNDCQITNYKID